MKRIVRNNKKWKWMVLLTSVFLIAFMAINSFRNKDDVHAADYELRNRNGQVVGSSYTMRIRNDTFTVYPTATNGYYIRVTLTDKEKVRITNTNSLRPDGEGYTYEGLSGRIEIEALSRGELSMLVDVYEPQDRTRPVYSENIAINVAFSINEYIGQSAHGIADINKIFPTDERSAIILEPDAELCFGMDAAEESERGYLNLTFGNASRITSSGAISISEAAEWESGNNDIISVDYNMKDEQGRERGGIKAEGAGHTTLSVRWRQGTMEFRDEIKVYVRPKITGENGESIDTSQPLDNGTIIRPSVKFEDHPLESISDKLVWVIAKPEGEGSVLVRDSLGNTTEEYKDEASLVWRNSSHDYRLNARAGTYIIQFYVEGTYKSFAEVDPDTLNCDAVTIQNGEDGVYVKSSYEDKTVYLNVGGTYNLPDAFNITKDTFEEHFSTNRLDAGTSQPSPTGDEENAGNTTPSAIGAINSECATMSDKSTIVANSIGTAIFDVEAVRTIERSNLKDIEPGKKARIIIIVTDTFSLNISSAHMSIGEWLDLEGILASGKDDADATYEWSFIDNNGNLDITETGIGKMARITAKKATQVGKPVTVVLKMTDLYGVTLTAYCRVTIDTNTSGFHINPSRLTMEAGDINTVTTDLKGTYKLAWISSDTSVATVVDSGTAIPSAQVTARKPGTTVITAVNASNNVYATCIVTVQQPITSLDIGIAGKKYTTYDTTLKEGFVFMEPLYQPSNATEKDFKWDSSDKTVATVDETGKVTLLKEGTTYISVASSKYTAFCILNIVTTPPTPISTITTEPKELSMVKGDTSIIKATYVPIDATDPTLVWTSLDEKVAKVDNTGKVTAAGVGATYINIEASLADSNGNKAKAIVKVTVRDKLTSIDFESKTTYVSIGSSKQLDIIFKPDKDVNKKVTFSSSDDSIFKVTPGKEEGTCIIQGIAAGQAVLSCVSEELGQAGVKTCMVYVTEADVATKDFIITPAAETVYIGQTLQMVKTFTPENATNQNVTWNSSDSGIASVTALGLVRGVKEGKVTVSAVYTDTANKVPIIRTSTIEVKPVPINVTDFDVTPDTQNIKVGEKFSLTPVFTPNNASNKNVDYQSLDEGVVTVSEKGEVIGIGAGDAIIQCQAEDGGFIATCMVHVENAIEFSLSPATREIAVGRSFKLKKVTNPENAKKTAEWSTSNSSIARVDATGKVTGRRIGSCTITCTLTRYNQSARCRVKVAKLKSKVTIDKKNIRLGVGQTYRLKKTVTSNDTSLPKVTWKSANKKVATVSSGGKITGKKEGLTKVTVTTDDSVRAKATCKVRVIQRVSSISLNSDYMVCYVGRSKKLTAKYRPSNATIKKVKWTSGDENIARVTGSGKVRGIAEGNTYITATTTDGSNKRARCFVKILDEVPVTSIVVAQTGLTLQRGDSRKLTYKVLPEDTSDSLEFASDNERVARVNKKGVVTAVGTGDATITILATSGASSNVDVNVVALNKTEINMRQYDSETLMVFGTTDTVTWYTSNARVATVDNGRIVGRSEGITYVYAYVNGCRLSCRVTITSVNS